MRHKKVMMMMAGLIPTPWEAQQNRLQRRINRYAAQLEKRSDLMAAIQRRERGEDGTKPMPFARKPE